MKLITASQVVRFAKEMEDKTEVFYKNLAEKYKEQSEVFSSFAKQSRKDKIAIQRAYQGVVTDAIETGFSFEEFVVDDYIPDMRVPEEASLSDAARKAAQAEEKMQKFYKVAAQMSGGLLADVSRSFEKILKKKNRRKEKLQSLI